MFLKYFKKQYLRHIFVLDAEPYNSSASILKDSVPVHRIGIGKFLIVYISIKNLPFFVGIFRKGEDDLYIISWPVFLVERIIQRDR